MGIGWPSRRVSSVLAGLGWPGSSGEGVPNDAGSESGDLVLAAQVEALRITPMPDGPGAGGSHDESLNVGRPDEGDGQLGPLDEFVSMVMEPDTVIDLPDTPPAAGPAPSWRLDSRETEVVVHGEVDTAGVDQSEVPTPVLGISLTDVHRAQPPEWGTQAPEASTVRPWAHTIWASQSDRFAVRPGPASCDSASPLEGDTPASASAADSLLDPGERVVDAAPPSGFVSEPGLDPVPDSAPGESLTVDLTGEQLASTPVTLGLVTPELATLESVTPKAVTPAGSGGSMGDQEDPPGDRAASDDSRDDEDGTDRDGTGEGVADRVAVGGGVADEGGLDGDDPVREVVPSSATAIDHPGLVMSTAGSRDNHLAALPESDDGSSAMQQPVGPSAVSAGGLSVATVPDQAVDRPAASAQWQPPGAPLAPAVPFNEEDRVQLVASLPTVDDTTPLAAEIAENARRRISLVGRAFPRPPHTRILTVANQKGGVGKTTTTVNVAAALAQAGLSVLVLDIDPQGNASTALGIDHHAEVPSLYDVVVEDRPLAEVVQPCPDIANLWVAPATIDLAGAEIELVSFVAREVRLKKAVEVYLESRRQQGLDQIDYVFIDCPPSLSLLTVNAFVAAREVLIPIQCEYYALEGLSQLLKHIELIRRQLNPSLHVSTIMLTMYDARTRLSSQVADEVRTHFPEQVTKTTVPRSVRISEAPSHGQTVMTYDPASSGALSYLEASRELAEQVLTWESTTREEQL